MDQTAEILLSIGGIMLLGMITDLLGRRTFLPRVTLLLLFGILIGPSVFNLLPEIFISNFKLITEIALTMVGFLVGGKLSRKLLKSLGKQLLWVSLGAVIGTVVIVSLVLILAGVPIALAILLGCIAAATDPAATMDVVEETKSKGPFVKLLTAVVALDDAWGLIVFSIGLAVVGLLSGLNGWVPPLLLAFKEIFGAILIGLIIGIPAAFLTGRVEHGKPMLIEALGIVFLCAGLAIWLGVSFLLASIVMGMTIVNLAKHHKYPFHAIENSESPFIIVFFVLAGASLELNSLVGIGAIGTVYIFARIAGKVVGVKIGGEICKADISVKNWMGLALLPQAGVAMGMALVAANHFPEYRQLLLSIVISTTILFELIGPVITNMVLRKTVNK
jgi:NhaP-type Na+/H+ or K+/H+ antiporter